MIFEALFRIYYISGNKKNDVWRVNRSKVDFLFLFRFTILEQFNSLIGDFLINTVFLISLKEN